MMESTEIESLRDRLMDLIEKRLELGTEGLSPGTIPSAFFNQKQALSDKVWLIPCRKLALI